MCIPARNTFQLGKASNTQCLSCSCLIFSLPPWLLCMPYFSFYTIFVFLCTYHPDVALCKGYYLIFGCWNQPMRLEVQCTLNPRRSAACPDHARSNSESYVEGFQLGKLRAHNPCTILPDRPYSPERARSTRYSPADHQPDSGKPLSVNMQVRVVSILRGPTSGNILIFF